MKTLSTCQKYLEALGQQRSHSSRRLRVEALEERCVLSGFSILTPVGVVDQQTPEII